MRALIPVQQLHNIRALIPIPQLHYTRALILMPRLHYVRVLIPIPPPHYTSALPSSKPLLSKHNDKDLHKGAGCGRASGERAE